MTLSFSLPSACLLLGILSAATVGSAVAGTTEPSAGIAGFTLPRSQVFELEDPLSQRRYQIAVQLPKSPAKLATAPQVYLLDAPYAFPIVTGAMRFPVNSGAMEDALVIGIGYALGDKGQASRVRDYTPTRDNDWKLTTGGAAAHANFIEQVLFDEIARRFVSAGQGANSTQTPRRIFIGNSLGGLFGGWLIQARPELFDDYILGSPSVWFDNEAVLKSTVAPIADSKPLRPGRVFIAVGSAELPPAQRHDMVAGARKLKARLSALPRRQLEIKYLEIPEADHSMAFLTSAIHGLSWLLGRPQND